MGAKKKARQEFAKEQELERLRARKETAANLRAATAEKLANMSPEEREVFDRKTKKRTRIILGLFGAAILLVIIGVAGGGSSTPSTPSTSAVFSGKVAFINVLDPATVNVGFEITNSGTGAGVPNCTIKVQNAGGSYTGFDSPIVSESVLPGKSLKANINLTVTHEGAAFVDRGSVTC